MLVRFLNAPVLNMWQSLVMMALLIPTLVVALRDRRRMKRLEEDKDAEK